LISHRYLRRIDDDPEAQILLQRLQNEGYRHLKNIWIERVFRLENGSETHTDQLDPLLCNPVAEKLTEESTLNPHEGPIFEVGYQRAVTDPETFSILRGARSLRVNSLNWARIAHRYQFIGLNQDEAREIISHYLYNPQVQVIIRPGEKWDSLKPRGETGPVKSVSLEGLSDRELQQLSDQRRLFLDNSQMKALQQIAGYMKRNMTDAELEMFAQTWSDHCFHTTWKSLGLLKLLQDATRSINHPLVLSMFEDNAGVMDFYNGWALTIKGETHNSPTAVSPYGGIMTKHGGVIRDTLGCGQGAWPIGGSTVMGLGDPRLPWNEVPDGALHPKTILLDAIRGTADYCNPMGIPMMFPVYRFHPGYTGKCFALGHSIGLIPSNRAKKGRPHPGDLAILIGGKTGRDGLHGATVSSASMTSETASVDAAHVQIGHPIQERKFMEAIPALRDQDCLHAVTDLGAAGLSSAAGEMGADTGIWINLAWVPLKTEGLFPWEIWISESQERMLLCVPQEKCEQSLKLLERFEVPASVIGKFTDSQRCQVIFDPDLEKDFAGLPVSPKCTGEQVVDLAFHDLRMGCPLPLIELQPELKKKTEMLPADCRSPNDVKSSIVRLLSHLNCSDQSAAGTQFDNTIQGNIVMGPYGGKDYRMPNDLWVSAPIRGEAFGAAASIAYNPFYGDVNPAGLAKLMMVESLSKLVGAGVNHREIVLCDNFYTPRVTPQVAFALKEMLETCSALSKQFGTPFISGKDSSSGTFINQENQRIDAPFTLCIMAMGRLPDVSHLVTKPFKGDGNPLYILGPLTDRLGGSVYLDTLGTRGMHLPDPEPKILLDLWNQLYACRKGPPLLSVSSIGEGGLMHRVFEMALGSGMGCRIDLEKIRKTLSNRRLDSALFAEMIGAWIIEVPVDSVEYFESRLPVTAIGSVTQENVIHLQWDGSELELKMDELIGHWEQPFREVAL
jgi:phosphoribosylformylglycinamidine synthase II